MDRLRIRKNKVIRQKTRAQMASETESQPQGLYLSPEEDEIQNAVMWEIYDDEVEDLLFGPEFEEEDEA